MRNKLNLYTFLILTIFALSIISCNNNQNNEPLSSSKDFFKEQFKNEIQEERITYPDRHYCPCKAQKTPSNPCRLPKHDCFPDIVVYGEKELSQINNLDSHINSNSVSEFFTYEENFNIIFPNFFGKALEDLQDGIITLRKLSPRDNVVIYYAVMATDTNKSPSYYYAYQHTNSSPICEEDSCNIEYIYR